MSEEYEELIPVSEDMDEEEQDGEQEEKIGIFDLFDDISQHGNFIENYYKIHGEVPKEYNVYMMNRIFANFPDTVLLANEMNKYYDIPVEMHWRFLKNAVTKRKRYSKWFKNMTELEPIEMLAKYYGCSVREMQKNINFMPKEKQHEILNKISPQKYKG